MMYKDEIITEVWRNRDAYARAYNHDLNGIMADLRKRQKEHSKRVVDRSPRRTTRSKAVSD